MKVIGEKNSETIICEVQKDEVCRVFNQYGYQTCGELRVRQALIVGWETDLGEGYRFRDEIKDMCRLTIDALKKFDAARKTMLAFAEMVVAADDGAAPKTKGLEV